MVNQIILVDFSSVAFKDFHALKELKTKDGVGSGMAFGVLKTLLYLQLKYSWRIGQLLIVLDGKAHWKRELFPDYKSNRKQLDLAPKMSVPLQFKITKLLLSFFGFNFYINDSEECDSTIFYLAKLFNKKFPNKHIIIVSNDHDMYQCLNPNTTMMICHSKVGEELFTEKAFIAKYNIIPEDYWKVQTLGGCTTDTVPGMQGIGEDSAVEIVKMNTWEKIISNDPELKFPNKRAQTMFRKNFSSWNYQRDERLVRLSGSNGFRIMKGERNEAKIREWFLKLEYKQFLAPANYNRMLQVFGIENKTVRDERGNII